MCFADSPFIKVDLCKMEMDVSWLENTCYGKSHPGVGVERLKMLGEHVRREDIPPLQMLTEPVAPGESVASSFQSLDLFSQMISEQGNVSSFLVQECMYVKSVG